MDTWKLISKLISLLCDMLQLKTFYKTNKLLIEIAIFSYFMIGTSAP